MTMHHFWALSGSFTSNNFFFTKPVNEPCFFYSCLSTSQKSKSDIDLLVKYWWFKNTKISLAESHFCLYLRTRFFPSMQFSQDVNNHKTFDFTQIPDKTNDMIFLTNEPCFWAIFDHFYLIGIFSKKPSCHTQLYMDL